MIVLVQAKVLTVGLDGRNEALQELPIRVVAMSTGFEAVQCLRDERVDGVISRWDLEDMRNGRFIKGLKSVKPDIPTVVFVHPGLEYQEVAARSLGVSAVLPDAASDELFRQTVASIFGLKGTFDVKTISMAWERQRQSTM